MDPQRIKDLLENVRAGTISADDALEQLKALPFEDLGFAKVDHHRALRTGFPEVIFGAGKSSDQIVEIARRLSDAGHNVLVTRLAPEQATVVRSALPAVQYNAAGRIATILSAPVRRVGKGTVVVVAAGTADLAVAEEAAVTAEVMGNGVERLHDVGISGIHRLLAHREQLRAATVLIVVAGMEGALPSVVAGLVDRPVIAVPTSVGYGASFGGLAALLAMLNSCAAAMAASLINRA
jgi:NCAIR mutase (PurE)-related protein